MEWKSYDYVVSPGRPKSLRPQIPVEIFYGGRNKSAMGLVDSGGDVTLMDEAIGESLGIVIGDCKEVSLGNVVSTDIKAHLAKIRIKIDDFDEEFEVEVRLVSNMALEVILGDNFFDKFQIRFERKRHKFYMKRE